MALSLGDLNTAKTLAVEANNPQKWSQLGELAANNNNLALAKECMHKAQDYSGLLLVATSTGDADLVKKLGEETLSEGKNNLSFLSYMLLGDLHKCLDILIQTDRLPEAAFFARSYLPDQISRVVQLWRQQLSAVNPKAGQSLADPAEYENLFPGLQEAIAAQRVMEEEFKTLPPAHLACKLTPNWERNPIEEMKSKGIPTSSTST